YFGYMVADGNTVTAPGVPYKDGYNFVGWKYYNKIQQDYLEYTGNVVITEDLTVDAVFEIKKHTVTFYFGDNLFKQVIVEHGNAPEFPTEEEVQKEGYSFRGWGQSINFVTSDMVVYASYERISVGVTFIVPDDGQYAVQNLYYGEYARVVSAPSKTGYTFVGWYTDREFTNAFSYSNPITESVWLYAKFTINQYAIIYYLDGVMHRTEYFDYGATIVPLGDVEFDGNRIFLGWSEIPQIMPAQTVIVTGSSKQLGTYKINYYINSTLYYTAEHVEGSSLAPLSAPTDLDETIVFKGWRNHPAIMPNYDVKVYADVENLSYYNIYYYVNGRFNISQMVLQGKPVVAPERPQGTLPENEVFNGWINVPEIMPTNHIRIDADITFLQYYTVRYYIDGYSRFVQQALEGKKFTVMKDPSNALPEDTIFNYWTYDENGDGNPVRVDCGSSMYMPSHDIEIHANVTKLQYYYVKYYIGDLLYHSRMVLEGKTVTPFNAPSNLPETTVFHAWLNEPEVMPNHDVRVDAEYTKYNYYTLSFYVGDRFYCSERILEGKPFSLPDVPTDLPENIIFNCWDYLGDFIMPSNDLTIYADYTELHEYVITYYINGVLYWTQTLLEGKP
ncbi:MAG: InlB B-repeat-containing protein, partial [Clostridia bacterium]|nr:InlB B-repeat-containing protein [Clostridia bacterium]